MYPMMMTMLPPQGAEVTGKGCTGRVFGKNNYAAEEKKSVQQIVLA